MEILVTFSIQDINLPQYDLFFLQRDLPELGDQVPEGRNQRLSARGFQNPHNFFRCLKKWFNHKKNGSISRKKMVPSQDKESAKNTFFSGGFHPRAFP